MKTLDSNTKTRCSFCGKEGRDVRKLISGPSVHICNECIMLCREIIEEDRGVTQIKTRAIKEMQPKVIKAFLDEHIIGQNKAKRALAVAVYNHYKRIKIDDITEEEEDHEDKDVELSKGNILLIGPTGSGKTLMAQTLAKKLDVPFTMADATSLTEAGYVGEDVENIIKNLYVAADRDAERTGKGIVCIDEIDKLGGKGGTSSSMRDVGGEGVQQALLKIIESSHIGINPEGSRNRPQQEFIQIDTSNILFMACGSFQGLTDIISSRMGESRMGFGADIEPKKEVTDELLHHVRPTDLTKFGLIPEFIGRFPVIVTFDALSEDMLVEILWKPKNSLVKQYQKLFELEDVKLRFNQDALAAIVREAIVRKTGARGLRAIIEEVMLDIMYELPSLEGIHECVITEDVILKKEKPLLVFEKESA